MSEGRRPLFPGLVAFRRLALLLALAALAAPAAAQERERIADFAAEVTVEPDGALTVEETIEVVARGEAIRRGIFRDLPLRAFTPAGFVHRAGFELLGATRDGAPEPFFTEPLDAGVRIYLGDPGRLLEPGRHRYTLTYRTDRQLLFRAGEDELYWNVTGEAWAFPIERAEVAVRLPGEAAALRLAAYSGARGEDGADVRLLEERPGLVRLETTRPLAPGEGFTLAVVWPEGAVARPGAALEARRWLRDNWGTLAAALLLLGLLAYYLAAWHRVGRDPEKGVVVPLFEPPAGLSAVGCGYVWNEGFGGGFDANRALTVALTSLATKGRLAIEEGEGKELTLRRASQAADGLPPGEKAVFEALFPEPEARTLSFGEAYEPRVGKARDALAGAFGGEFARLYFRANLRWWLIGAGLAVLAVLAALLPQAPGEEALIMTLFLLPFAVAFVSAGLVFLGTGLGRLVAGPGRLRRLPGTLGRLGIAAAALLPVGVMLLFASEVFSPMALRVAVLALVLPVGFWFLMKAPTRVGRRILDELEGYRLYLSVAEAHRLELAGREPAITEALYERHLPYAMALGVEQAWSDKAEARLAASSAEAAGGDQPRPSRYRPRWYRSDRDWAGPAALPRALGGSLASAASTAATRPSSSSGGSSGGSVGGGGGGGGGGGW